MNLANFLKEQTIYLDDEKSGPIHPDGKYTVLRHGLLNYYQTVSDELFHLGSGYLYKSRNHIVINESTDHDFITKYFSSISNIHLFYEILIKELLNKISPLLSKGRLNKEIDIVHLLAGKLSSIKVPSDKFIPYKTALERIRILILNHNSLPKEYQVDLKYHFLLDHINTLKQLANLRNDLIHSGNSILSKFAYELFFANYIIPLIYETLRVVNRIIYLERDVFCKLNVLNELNKLKLNEDYEIVRKYRGLEQTLKHINHLKLLGFASYNNPIMMMEHTTDKVLRREIEERENKPIRIEAEIIALFKQKHLGYHEIFQCPCCGSFSLVTFGIIYLVKRKRKQVRKAKCLTCEYQVKKNFGEPMDFGIMNEKIFNYVY